MTFDRVAARKRCEEAKAREYPIGAAPMPPSFAELCLAALDELDDAVAARRLLEAHNQGLVAVVAERDETIARLREALGYYADPDLWSPDGQGGAVARQALSDTTGASDGK